MDTQEEYITVGGLGSNLRYHRHTNPDGTKGGWVGINAYVAKTAYIGQEARVEDGVRIKGRARILDRVHVSGSATIEGDAVLCGEAQISGAGCTVKGSAVLSGKTAIRSIGGTIEGYTHLSDIELDEDNIVISGGEYKGNSSTLGGSYLRFITNENGNVTGLYLSDDLSDKNTRRELPQTQILLQHISHGEQNRQAKDTRGR